MEKFLLLNRQLKQRNEHNAKSLAYWLRIVIYKY